MTTNNSKYKEAAKEYASESISEEDDLAFEECVNTFLAGASFAEKEKVDRLKNAHNNAIDKAIDLAYNVGLGDFAVELDKLKI